MKALALLLALLLCSGCALSRIEPGDTVYLSSNLSVEQQQAALDGVDELDRSTRGASRLDLRIGGELGQHAIVLAPNLETCGLTIASRWRDTVVIQLRPDCDLRVVIMHELLHAFGHHVHEDTGIMTDPLSASCLTERDAQLFCDLYGCPRGVESTCEVEL